MPNHRRLSPWHCMQPHTDRKAQTARCRRPRSGQMARRSSCVLQNNQVSERAIPPILSHQWTPVITCPVSHPKPPTTQVLPRAYDPPQLALAPRSETAPSSYSIKCSLPTSTSSDMMRSKHLASTAIEFFPEVPRAGGQGRPPSSCFFLHR